MTSLDQNILLRQHGATSCWGVCLVNMKSSLLDGCTLRSNVGETTRGLLPLIQRCPTSTLGSNKYSDLFPHSSTGGVGISSDEMKRGADLPLPNPFQFVRVIDLTSQFVVVPKKSITLPPYRSSGTVACPAAPSLVPDAPIIQTPTRCTQEIYHPSALSVLRDGSMPGGAFSGAIPVCTGRQ